MVALVSVSLIQPNPFTTQTAIHYTVPSEGAGVAIKLYDIRGRLVRTLVDRNQAGGVHEAAWDGRDGAGREVPAGVYFVRASSADETVTRKVLVLH